MLLKWKALIFSLYLICEAWDEESGTAKSVQEMSGKMNWKFQKLFS